MNFPHRLLGGLALTLLIAACNNSPSATTRTDSTTSTNAAGLKEETISFPAGGAQLQAYVVYNDSLKGRRPAVLVIPEWWGLNDYPKMRARMLADLGYVAMALDVYGNGKVADNPDSAGAWSGPFYKDPQLAKQRIDTAIARLKTYDNVDTSKIGAIGYCFGGGLLLNTVRLGDDLKAIVSFHGAMPNVPARKDLLKTKILVCQGNADKLVTPDMVARFRKQMDSIGAPYTLIGYDSAMHAFSNPASTAAGKKFNLPIAYNAKADTASWNAMKDFFHGVFGE